MFVLASKRLHSRPVLIPYRFRGQRLLQNQETLHLSGAQLVKGHPSESASHQKVLQQFFALCGDVRLRATFDCHSIPRPDRRGLAVGRQTQPAAATADLQAVPPARVALPTGLVGKLKMEGD